VISDEREPLAPLSRTQREALEEAVSAYQSQLTAGAARYLMGRGIEQEVADTFRVGEVVDPAPGHERFVGMLSIPYLDREGAPVSIRFRCIRDHDHREHYHGKYNSMTGEPARLFNVAAIHRAADEIHLAEGEFDAIVLDTVFGSAVGVPGANSWLGRHRRMLAGFSRIWVWADPDAAGAELMNKVARSLRSAKGVRLRGGDVTDVYLSGGPEALRELIEGEQ
jgi:DNA primase